MVSPSAETCPKCGKRHPTGAPVAYKLAQILVILFGVLVSLGSIGHLLQPSDEALKYQQYGDEGEAALDRVAEAARRSQHK